MCVIVVKPMGVDYPEIETLAACWDTNPDGAGIMYNRGGEVRIEKGCMSWDAFRKRYEKLMIECPAADHSVVMHFRIATHGEVSKECCHPFPVSSKLKDLRKLSFTCPMGVAHNGIISGRDTSAKKSDTMDYIMKIIAPLSREVPDFTKRKGIRQMIENTISGSRMAFLEGDGAVTTIGTWYTDDGCIYSNLNHKWTYKSMHSRAWNYYYDDEDFEDGALFGEGDDMENPPSELCEQLCPWYDDCIEYGLWSCYSEAHAEDTIEKALIYFENESLPL